MLYGDFNTFDDKDGTAQREYMLETCSDLASPMYSNGKKLSGTFIGFPHDAHKQSYNNMSRLDHVFTPHANGLQIQDQAISPQLENYTLDNTNYETFNYPSDHIALSINVLI